jgi:drug/metabolite transporter (DMT)-like permease
MSASLFFIIFLIFLTSVCDTARQLFLKTAINSLNWHLDSVKKVFFFILKLVVTPRVWIGFVFSCLSLFIWLFVLSRAELSFAFSVDSMHYILIALASGLILKEKVGPKRWIGTLLIVLGIVLVTLSGQPG